MSNEHTSNHGFLWFIASFVAVLALAIIFVPPMINLNSLKPKIENIIFSQTGISAQIHGNVNFSMLGKTHLVAHNISVPNGIVSSAEFAIPFFDIFNMENANISGDISIKGASLFIEKLVPFNIKNTIIVHDSKVKFLNKEYNIINAKLSKSDVDAIVRTDQHKYEIKSVNNVFTIKNKNNDLKLTGKLFNNGTASGHIEIIAQNINRWFEFDKPRINGRFLVSADFSWDGNYGVKFYDIYANGVTGAIEFRNDGYRIVNLKSENADFDLSFFVKNPEILQNASFDLDFYGNLKFMDKNFQHININTTGSAKEIKINTVIADNMKISDGTIDGDGAHNLNVSLPENGINTTCVFNGTPTKWSCDRFTYGKIFTGNLAVDQKTFVVNVYSSEKIEDITNIINSSKKFGDIGMIKFNFPDMAGIIKINHDKYDIKYDYAKDKNLLWAKIDLPFLPNNMLNEIGDFVWEYGSIIFVPISKQWRLALTQDFFTIRGDDFKTWFPNIDLQLLKDLPYVLSGTYKKNNISNLTLEINGYTLTGSMSNKSVTLKTDYLNLDSLLDKSFFDNYEELSFFVAHPLTIPFDFNTNLALSANKLVYNKNIYDNFVYSLKNDVQTFSITDSNHGNILATITKDKTKYALNIELNKFILDEKLLPVNMPLNLSDTIVTATIKLNTSGMIAHDIMDNLNGTFDISFDGGKLYGLGFDTFYASANDISTLNVEQRLAFTLQSGITEIKKMHIIGTYENGIIKTTSPLILSMKHIESTGMFELDKDKMFAKLNFVLRGTSPEPEPIDLTIYSDGKREYSLSQIMMNFDPEYMRTFIKTRDKF